MSPGEKELLHMADVEMLWTLVTFMIEADTFQLISLDPHSQTTEKDVPF